MKKGCKWDTQSDDEKSKLLSGYGLSSTATFEQIYQADLKSLFSVREYKITSDAKDNAGKSCIKLTLDGSEYSTFLYSVN